MKMPPIIQLIDTLAIQSPIIGFCNPKVELLDKEQCSLTIPLSHQTKSHINTLGFGPLAIGADLTGGLLALYLGQFYDKPLDFCFSKAEILFLRKPISDVFFSCLDGAKINNTLKTARESGTAHTVDIHIQACVYKGQLKKSVAKFMLTLFVHFTE
jgi:hypothetical protein